MSEKMDHAAEAINSAKASAEYAPYSPEEGMRGMLQAQMHATLALVEQQRIANLIAYASHRIEHPNAIDVQAGALRRLLGTTDFEIRQALGLNEEAPQP